VPELADVEGFRRYFARYAAGRRVKAVDVHDRSIVRNATPRRLRRSLEGRRLGRPTRHGKWLLVPAGDLTVLFHFGMTGGLQWTSRGGAAHSHDRVVFRLEGGELRYRNMRKLGGIWLARSEHEVERVTGALGPDALEVGREDLEQLLERRRGGLKAALMDQRLLAGMGNELSDEILWQARLHPRRTVRTLQRRERDALYRAFRKVLVESARRGRVPRAPGWLTTERGRREPSCPRCGARIERGTVAERTAYWCPRCQRARAR
jgi:formamidopyrimidine-DNA glycosylase